MIPESTKQSIDRWLDGDLPIEQIDSLRESLGNDPQTISFLCDRALLHQMLSRSAAFEAPRLAEHSIPDFASLSPARTPISSPARTRHRWIVLASALVIGFLTISVLLLPRVGASPARWVERTLVSLETSLDRCYWVVVEAGTPLRKRTSRRSPAMAESTLWVHGDQFVQFFGDPENQLIWGRDSESSVWFTRSGGSVAIFANDDVPEVLQEACDLRTLHLPKLLESLLRNYQLQFGQGDSQSILIVANPKAAATASKFGRVEMEIEAQSLMVQRISLERLHENRVVATVTFSLKETQPQDVNRYELETYLKPGAVVFDRPAQRGRRAELLRDFLLRLRVAPEKRQGTP